MKIGILTFHYAHNAGACLQAFALKEYISSFGHNVTIINYQNHTIHNLYPKKLTVPLTFYDFKHPNELNKKLKLRKDYRFGRKEWKIQHKRFESFINHYLLEGKREVLDSNKIGNFDFDLIVGGSDQIWNKQLTGGLDLTYLLDFKTKARKGFYAASSGTDVLDDDDIKAFESIFLSRNNYISVREPTLSVFLSDVFKRSVPSVVDPCFLLSPEDYIRFFSLDNFPSKPKKRYLLAYFISEKNKRIREMVYVIANALGLDIVELHYRKNRDMNKKYQTSNFDPIEFLQLIYHSDFIVTNSFHGTVFSIMFKKQFYSVYKEDARKDNVLKAFNLSHRHIRDFSEINLNEKVSFEDVNLNDYTSSSKQFLSEMIRGCANNE